MSDQLVKIIIYMDIIILYIYILLHVILHSNCLIHMLTCHVHVQKKLEGKIVTVFMVHECTGMCDHYGTVVQLKFSKFSNKTLICMVYVYHQNSDVFTCLKRECCLGH